MKASVDEYEPKSAFIPEKFGYGVGHKDFEIPNVLRIVLGESTANQVSRSEQHYKIEANIDDMAAENFEPLIQDLMATGAGDVFFTPIIMKKSRPATCLSVLSNQANVHALADMILNRSSTIGLRIVPFTKRILPRELKEIETSFGTVRIKEVTQPDGRKRWKSEYEDVQRIAVAKGKDFRSVKQLIDFEIMQQLPGTNSK